MKQSQRGLASLGHHHLQGQLLSHHLGAVVRALNAGDHQNAHRQTPCRPSQRTGCPARLWRGFAYRLVQIFCTKYLWLMSVRSLRPPSLPVAQGIANAVFLELAVERGLADSKQLRGLQFVAIQSSNRSDNRLAFHFSECGHSCTALAMSGFDSNRRDASCLKTLLL